MRLKSQPSFFRRILLALIVLALMGTLTAVAQEEVPREGSVSVAEYWQHMRELEALVRRIETLADEAQRTEMEKAADELAQITAVLLPGGEALPIDHSFLIQLMRTVPPDLPRLSALLVALEQTRQSWPDPQFTEYDPAPLMKILAEPEFQYQPAEPSRLEQWWQDVRQRIGEWISRLLPDGIGASGELLDGVLTVVGTLVLLVVLFYAMRDIVADFVRQAELPSDGEQGAEILTAESAFKQAQQLSEGGDFRTAVRYLYLSALLILEERGLLHYDRSRTNREYLGSVGHRPELASILREVVEVFDQVWYGYQQVDVAAFRRYTARVEALKRLR